VDFVKYLTSVQNQTVIAANGSGIPVVKGAEAGLTDPNMLQVQQTFAAAKYFQLYYDQFLPPATGSVLNDSVQGLFAGSLTPEQVAQAVEDSVAQEMK
jgi:raffinose/stachyose/melibiose transport system substrate-binding protein